MIAMASSIAEFTDHLRVPHQWFLIVIEQLTGVIFWRYIARSLCFGLTHFVGDHRLHTQLPLLVTQAPSIRPFANLNAALEGLIDRRR